MNVIQLTGRVGVIVCWLVFTLIFGMTAYATNIPGFMEKARWETLGVMFITLAVGHFCLWLWSYGSGSKARSSRRDFAPLKRTLLGQRVIGVLFVAVAATGCAVKSDPRPQIIFLPPGEKVEAVPQVKLVPSHISGVLKGTRVTTSGVPYDLVGPLQDYVRAAGAVYTSSDADYILEYDDRYARRSYVPKAGPALTVYVGSGTYVIARFELRNRRRDLIYQGEGACYLGSSYNYEWARRVAGLRALQNLH